MRATLLLALALSALPAAHAQEDLDVKPALAAAEAWLALLDEGGYGRSWDAATPALREAMPRAAWEKAMVAARQPLGLVISRKLRSATFTRGATPEGDYVVIEYDTRFEGRPFTIEVVTPARGREGAWTVSNYIIR